MTVVFHGGSGTIVNEENPKIIAFIGIVLFYNG